MEINKSNKFLIKSKKQMFAVIAVFTLLLFVGGTTYAFFNYTRTGAQNTVRTGTINFSSSETENTVTLNNVFPVSASTIGTASESANDVRTVEITIDGNTTYNGGIEYVLTLDDVNIETDTTPKKEIPLSLNVSVEGLDSKTIGTPSDDYFTARGNNTTPSSTALYQILAKDTVKQDEQILVGYIPKNVDVKGKIIVKAYIDASKVLITDTPVGNDSETDGYINGTDVTGKTVITTTEWNSINRSPLSFRVKVEANEGIWVDGPITLISVITSSISDNNTVDFNKISPYSANDLNGQGIQLYDKITYGIDSDGGTDPIYYYRGNVIDNNVEFGGFCWKIIRTTSTGGTKLIFNGLYSDITKCNNMGTATQITVDNRSAFTFNNEYDDDKYLGYTYDTNVDSNAKKTIDKWFSDNIVNNIANYNNYLEDVGFCNDRSGGVSTRLLSNKTPSLGCPNENNDLYTLSGSLRGNKKLAYPVALITADEVVLAGGKYSDQNTAYYLYTGEYYWTMSAFGYDRYAKVYNVRNYADLYIGATCDTVNGLRPSISLKSGVVIANDDANGTVSNPYHVVIE